ncbi:MAG: methyltransferase domain-containing protein [Bacteroidales bacterium]|nr:methyltransferase domain-containing protein [Bacteroidales bacterium]
MMKNTWDERYAQPEYIYGKQPNAWLAEKLKEIPVGRILFPAEGEGRNAVYAATLGWEVTAFDQSAEGRSKALRLAAEKNVQIVYNLSDLTHFEAEPGSFDVIALIFVHMPEEIRSRVHKTLTKYLKPGGYLILEAFTKDQLKNNSGGPKTEQLLYNNEQITGDFPELDFLESGDAIAHLDEGLLHRGEANVVRLFARKAATLNH